MRKRRESLGRSIRSAATLAEVSNAWLSQLERGDVDPQKVHVNQLVKLVRAYEITIGTYFKLIGVDGIYPQQEI